LKNITITRKQLIVEVLAGLVVALALIPEAISFSILAGVDPKVGLFASFTMAVTISITGGRKAMISAATGAIALVIAPLVKEQGVNFLFAAVILGGVLQIIFASLGVVKLMRFIPRSVMVGFVNSLAVLIFSAQLPHLIGKSISVWVLMLVGLAIIFLAPRVISSVPAPLIAIVVLTFTTNFFGMDLTTVGDEGKLPTGLPLLGIPSVPMNMETFGIIFPYAIGIALVGLIESLLTAKLVDDITDTRSDKTRESIGQGIANVVTGFFGGMGGCAMIGQTMINVKSSGARTRISTFLAGAFLLTLVLAAGPLISAIPMASLVAVMIMVSYLTFDWHSISPVTLRRMPKSETFVMLITVAVVVLTHNLAYGVIAGVFVEAVLFARRVAHVVQVTGTYVESEKVMHYKVTGELFFASSNDLYYLFDYNVPASIIQIDFSEAHVWDGSSVAALDSIIHKYELHGKRVEITGMNQMSQEIHEKLSGGFPAS
jgi:sulfate permease, SulP family